MTEKRQSKPGMWLKRVFLILFLLLCCAGVGVGTWLLRLDRDIKTRFAEKRFAPPVEFLSAPEFVSGGEKFPHGYFAKLFTRKNYRSREFGQPLQPGDVSFWTGEECLSVISAALPPLLSNAPPPEIRRCVSFHSFPTTKSATTENPETVQIIAISTDEKADDSIAAVFAGTNPHLVNQVSIEPELFAQYYGDVPILRRVVNLGTVPTSCLNGLIAIEDAKFLEHPGISYTGLARAMLTVIQPGRRAQGGSTLTQQLVKNYFLTDERTLKRKLIELPMALLVERHASKDEILETYINLIYMGQNGPFQVRGLAAASQHYFAKPIEDLDLSQCALLVGLLNNPGYFNPFHAAERALKRRAMVLDRMLELKMIDGDQAKLAKAEPLPNRPERNLTEPAPYFIQAVRRQLIALGIDEAQGLRVFTTLNLRAQETAHQVVRAGLDRLETTRPALSKLKSAGKNLEAVLLSANPATGAIEAMVGGRGFQITQFNRATDSRRQVGSIMKPFVYLTAFESRTPEGKPYTPLSRLPDKPTTLKFEGQVWTPHNFEPEFFGDIPIFWALKESINVATVNLGMEVGLGNIIDTARRLGLTSTISPLPSLTLGAFELSPLEVLQSYSTIAQLGSHVDLTMLDHIEDLVGTQLYRYEKKPLQVTSPQSAAELVGVMKQTVVNGTAKAVGALGFTHPAAGKTGTTNDKKDSWFAGFTPHHAALVWVGYDDNTIHGLTGAIGAVPIWTEYMKAYASTFPPDDFNWPPGVEKVVVSPEKQIDYGVPAKGEAQLKPIELVFKSGESPL